ncbi:phospholipase domain-containing protein, partial [Streptomyces albus]|uniref:phospholipase domain-containing protein n=1 Tax=Streptomyces albus TaxID=1888 RepID=UPI000AF9FD57
GGTTETDRIPAGARLVRTVNLRGTEHWYDLTVTCDTDRSWLRRLAGHVETGRPGVSDPATLTT